MSSILRQIVAGPRLQHPEAGLDLCYVTNNIIATSGPSATYPQRAYRNPLDELVSFLDSKHDENWCIWEFRAEGTGYPDSEVYNRIRHFPWPDHNPPPFALIPNIMGSMRNWLHPDNKDTKPNKQNQRVAVVHCKAGKGRSGTIAAAYLISQEGWSKEDALQRFTERRMRVGFGNGVSIPSQLRYVGYVDRWAKEFSKEYVERPVEILEVHIWGLRNGVKVSVQGFVDEGKKIKCFHTFHRSERTVVAAGDGSSRTDGSSDFGKTNPKPKPTAATWSPAHSDISSSTSAAVSTSASATASSQISRRTTLSTRNLSAMIFLPHKPIPIPSSDVNIDFERRSKATYTGFPIVTSVAHVWFNAYFEGGHEHDSGVFETAWDAMDGIKGSLKKGIRAFERLTVVWRYARTSDGVGVHVGSKDGPPSRGKPVSQPKPGESVHESVPTAWRGRSEQMDQENRVPGVGAEARKSPSRIGDTLSAAGAGSTQEPESLGLREQTESKDVSLAGSEDETRSGIGTGTDDEGRLRTDAVQNDENGDFEGVRSYFGRNGNGNSDGDEKEKEKSQE